MNNIKILIIPISNPILIGIYKNDKLIKTISEIGKTSDILPILFKNILQQYNIKEIIYVNEPGSFMAIKITYIFLKTLAIVNNITLKAIDGFVFNNNSPIKALAKKYFFKKNGIIYLDKLNNGIKIEKFKLPKILNINTNDNILPEYHLPITSE